MQLADITRLASKSSSLCSLVVELWVYGTMVPSLFTGMLGSQALVLEGIKQLITP